MSSLTTRGPTTRPPSPGKSPAVMRPEPWTPLNSAVRKMYGVSCSRCQSSAVCRANNTTNVRRHYGKIVRGTRLFMILCTCSYKYWFLMNLLFRSGFWCVFCCCVGRHYRINDNILCVLCCVVVRGGGWFAITPHHHHACRSAVVISYKKNGGRMADRERWNLDDTYI